MNAAAKSTKCSQLSATMRTRRPSTTLAMLPIGSVWRWRLRPKAAAVAADICVPFSIEANPKGDCVELRDQAMRYSNGYSCLSDAAQDRPVSGGGAGSASVAKTAMTVPADNACDLGGKALRCQLIGVSRRWRSSRRRGFSVQGKAISAPRDSGDEAITAGPKGLALPDIATRGAISINGCSAPNQLRQIVFDRIWPGLQAQGNQDVQRATAQCYLFAAPPKEPGRREPVQTPKFKPLSDRIVELE